MIFNLNNTTMCAIALLSTAFVAGAAHANQDTAATTSDDVTLAEIQAGTAAPEPRTDAQAAVQEDVDTSSAARIEEKRAELIEEAVMAIEMTRKALSHLDGDEPDTDAAINQLEQAVGKLDLLMARRPELAMIPVAATQEFRDLIVRKDTVKRFIDEARKALQDGRVQDARRTLDALGSEMVIRTTHLPLATYPDAIRMAVPMIDSDRIDDAKVQIQTALNMLYIEEQIYPLPLLRAEAMLATAEGLAEESSRTEGQNTRLDELLTAAEREIEFGQLLGYYAEDDAEPLRKQMEQIRKKTSDGKSGEGFFDKIKSLMSDLF